MTNPTENKEKEIPAFYIFAKDGEGISHRVGAAFSHNTGKGINLVIDNKRYVAFPPKAKPETGEGA
jgi:hypothetical protein